MRVRECTTQDERARLAESVPAEIIKERLLKFLRSPANDGARLFYEHEEVVEELLDDPAPTLAIP